LQELQRDPHLVAAGMTVQVRSGIVELGGTTTTSLSRGRAERIARVVRDVRAVVNHVRITEVRRRDADVARDVSRALRATAALAPMPISVKVSGGVVELVGRITSWEEQQLAERVASGVPGARFCQNQLSAGFDVARSEAVLAGDVRSRLAWDPLTEHDPIQVAVYGTRVVLTGTTGSNAEAQRATTLGWVKGATAVDAAGITVDTSTRPDPNVRLRWPSDEQITVTIQELAHYWPDVPMPSVTVAVLDGVVTLRGNVAALGESAAAEAMARSAVGVVKVDNQLRGPWWRAPVSLPTPTLPRRRSSTRR
jgi:osmotically-inducible protein OsmY